MAFQLQTAKRDAARLKIALGGASGAGKTMSALLLGYGLLKAEHPEWDTDQIWSKIAVIDTENHSAGLYVGKQVSGVRIGGFQVLDFPPPYDPKLAVEAIDICINAGMEVVIADSLSAFWIGEGGSLDQQSKIAERSGNSWTAWRSISPNHNKLVDKIIQSPVHFIGCMRAKTAYEQTQGANGKKSVKAIGMELQMRDGIQYEFTTVFMLDYDHVANATKDRTGMFDGQYFVITPDTGRKFAEWLKGDGTVTEPEKPKPQIRPAVAPATTVDMETPPNITLQQVDEVIRAAAAAGDKKAVLAKVKEIAGVANYMKVEDPAILAALYNEFKGE